MANVKSLLLGGGITPVFPNEKIQLAHQELHQLLTNLAHDQQRHSEYGHTVEQLRSLPEIKILFAAPASHVDLYTKDTTNISQQENEAYRCKCSFQIIPRFHSMTAGGPFTAEDDFNYAIRKNGNILPLLNGNFPPANHRIRRAMREVLEHLNAKQSPPSSTNNKFAKTDNHYKFLRIRNHLNAVTFVSSWASFYHTSDNRFSNAASNGNKISWGDCSVTFHYSPPGLYSPLANDTQEKDHETIKQTWEEEAKQICLQCNLISLTGRSKKIKFNVFNSKERFYNLNGGESIIRDDLWLTIKRNISGGCILDFEVSYLSLNPPHTSEAFREIEANSNNSHHIHIKIQYHKPETAFQHPNARVMLTSLHWILTTLSKISAPHVMSFDASHNKRDGTTSVLFFQKLRLLELYCGCGAHTIPLAKSNLLSEIVAVEADERLATACRNNCQLNHCLKRESESFFNTNDGDETMVSIFKGDATEWANKMLHECYRKNITTNVPSSKSDNKYSVFDILLVDPPRDGLHEKVCDMALKGTFCHVIYVSCGLRALIRDIKSLCMGGYVVVDLAVIDLFPGTDSVETLVHLRRDHLDNSSKNSSHLEQDISLLSP